ncbi:hypothetical protein L1285_22120 [Pseudoalteromonas sp. DL2-H2.2]|uniref:hypothetical protein n=1 Tax=Pseudoalteromonas sp. DL2-H2.2 TaxID=2908889 RepID=UPI001F4908CF|nr:hypothetical protein [Pseudoalteromonas sp. DL2-H2.2]MCF2911004.1 hypothetical protein [Pseudoalteromonas sp. DL2-H2.2]
MVEVISHNCAMTMDSDWVIRMSFAASKTGKSTDQKQLLGLPCVIAASVKLNQWRKNITKTVAFYLHFASTHRLLKKRHGLKSHHTGLRLFT